MGLVSSPGAFECGWAKLESYSWYESDFTVV